MGDTDTESAQTTAPLAVTIRPDETGQFSIDGHAVSLRMMERGDAGSVLAFAKSLSPHDLLFLRRDITRQEQVEHWIANIEQGLMATVLALRGDRVVGYATVDRGDVSWSQHVAELRVLVDEAHRGKGLGQRLTRMAFNIALEQGIEKMMAQMTLDQRGAISVFERMGFRAEALLHDHVKDRDGVLHDLLVMSQRVGSFRAHPTQSAMEQALTQPGANA